MKACLQKVPDEWPFKRDFRLYKANCRDRWEDQYWAIMFCTPPFRRMRDIELENLMDRELLSRLIAGMSVEINASLTIFGASIFEPEGVEAQVYWMPIEGYSSEEKLTPPRFNKFCDCLRNIEMKRLVGEFEAKSVSVDNCPVGFGMDGKCADKEYPACMREPVADWCHCPAFTEERKARSLCYSSDLILIDKVASSEPETAMENGVEHQCPAGFTEFGFPVMVHDHLVAVVMIGQVFSKPDDISDIGDLLEHCAILDGCEGQLEEAKKALIQEEVELKERMEPRFFLSADEVRERIALLRPNIERITEMANARYRDIRRRSEAVFREELLEHFQSQKNKPDFFSSAVPNILRRMREFWAFKAVYLVAYSYTSKDICVLAMSLTNKGEKCFPVPGKKVGEADPAYRQTHPIRYLYRGAEPQRGLDPLVKDLLDVFDDVSEQEEFSVERGKTIDPSHLFVLVPFYNEVYAFVFSVRDEKGLCRLERAARGDVSELCQETILRVCTEVVYEFGDVWYRKASEQAWREFSVFASHRIGNEVSTVGMLLENLGEELASDPRWQSWAERLSVAIECVSRSKDMLREQVKLTTAEIKPKCKEINLANVIGKGAAGILREDNPLTVQGDAAHTSIWADPDLIEEVFRELFINAVRAAGPRAALTVEISKGVREVLVSVEDNGPGISLQQAGGIFKPHVAMKGQSTGLGLATVQRIVAAHGGTIRLAESTGGAKFLISLPFGMEVR